MNSTRSLLLLLTLTLYQPAYGHTFEAVKISESSIEVILHDTATGEEWLAEVGDELDGYRVVEITEEHVTLSKLGDDQTINLTKIPLKSGGLVNVNP